jgi:SH3 domain-containing YSC84-like protein 1
MGSVRFGSGILVARLDDGSWSAPSAIVTGGLGAGGQFGVEFTNFIFVLPNKSSVRTFAQSGSLTLTANISMAVGPMGRCGEVGMGASPKGFATMWAMSKTNGLFGGVSIEAGTVIESRSSNEKLYQRKLTAAQLLNGEIEPPADAMPLMAYLVHEAFYPSRDCIPDPEQPSEPSTVVVSRLPSGVENQSHSETTTHEALQKEPAGLANDTPSLPLEEREISVQETGNYSIP